MPLRSARARKARIVVGQEPAEGGDGAIQQNDLGCLVHRVDERQETIAAVDEPVAIAFVDSRREQRRVEHLIGLVSELGLDGVGTAFLAGSLYVGWFPLAGLPVGVRSLGLAMAVCYGWETLLQTVIHPGW